MTDRPWFKFYPGDWLGDAGLQACSLEARGLWIQLIAIMHQAKPYGHLLISGNPPTNAQISQLVHSNARTVAKLMRELEAKGVWNRNERADGTRVIYSRRMVRDELKRQSVNDLKNGNDPTANIKKVQVTDHPYSRKKERGQPKQKYPPNKQTFRRARHRWENELLRQYGPDEFANALEVLAANPTLVTRATNAELREPGSGVMAAVLGLRQLNGGSP